MRNQRSSALGQAQACFQRSFREALCRPLYKVLHSSGNIVEQADWVTDDSQRPKELQNLAQALVFIKLNHL